MVVGKRKLRAFVIFVVVGAVSIRLGVLGYNIFLRAVYPLKYESIVNQASRTYNIEPETIYAVIKSESGFDNEAKSSAGALGLMQITPDTFQWLQLYTKDSYDSPEYLKDPGINIDYGTLLMSILRKKYDSEEAVLCAYNAGVSTVDKWLKDETISDGKGGLAVIPYKETREYVRKIRESREIYKNLYF